jgi:acetylornithine deacetylase/succinyl-diaminopimelate desuccinylase-like protein
MVGEKGTYWCRLSVRGTPGHGSMPFRTDNALVKAAEVVTRIAEYQPETKVNDVWRRFVESLDLPEEISRSLLDPARVREFAGSMDDIGLARLVHACTHTTFAPTIVHGGVKTNIIPDSVQLDLDIRTLPGQSGEDIEAMIRASLGDLAPEVEIEATGADLASESPMNTPLWDSLQRVTQALVPGASMVPFMQVGATDARFFRRIGTTSYGYGLFSERISFGEFMSMFHGDDERVDLESLELTTTLWDRVVRDFLG